MERPARSISADNSSIPLHVVNKNLGGPRTNPGTNNYSRIWHFNPSAPNFPEDLLPKHKKSLKIHKSLIYWYILKIFTGLVGINLD
jgi:hypothetical protein